MELTKRQKVRHEYLPSVKKEQDDIQNQTSSFNFIDIYSKCENPDSIIDPRKEINKKNGNIKLDVSVLQTLYRISDKKEYLDDASNKFTLDRIDFDIMSGTDILRSSEIEVYNREYYKYLKRDPSEGGVLDKRLGCHTNDVTCSTCSKGLSECVGHWGSVQLELPVYHFGFFKHTVMILKCICKKCSCLLLPEETIKKLLNSTVNEIEDPLLKPMRFKSILEQCKNLKKKLCPRCNTLQGDIKVTMKPSLDQFMKIRHSVKYKEHGSKVNYEEDLNPLYVRNLFRNIDPLHAKVLNMVDPEKLIISNLPVPPCCIRTTVSIEGKGTTEDDLTVTLSDIISINNTLKSQIKSGFQATKFILNWRMLQVQVTRYISTESQALVQLLMNKNISKPGRGICQRLKGKEGRFRGNLSGKRVDFSARTVISPDPNVGISEVVVPEWIARRLTFPERVTRYNINVMKKAVLNSVSVWPGATHVHRLDGTKSTLRYANQKHVSESLQIGEIVERHLWNGDLIIFNRQPSLHRLSIMCHKARVMKGSTFRFNECVCPPYNADFDGDEMNVHLPQTYEAKAEALHLMGVEKNLTTPRNGEPLIAPVQDFLCCSYLLTSKDTFLNMAQFCQVISHFTDAKIQVDIPPPSILHPVTLWTGKQVFNVLIKPNKTCKVMVNIRVKEREYTEPNEYYRKLYNNNKENLDNQKVDNNKKEEKDEENTKKEKYKEEKEEIKQEKGQKQKIKGKGRLKRGGKNINIKMEVDGMDNNNINEDNKIKIDKEMKEENNKENEYRCINNQHNNNEENTNEYIKLDECMCPHDGFVVIYKSELLCGSMGVRSLGASKGGLFHELMLKNSPKISSECMLRVSKLSSRWLSDYGMTIGLDDVTPSEELLNKKKQLLLDGYNKVDEVISNFEFLQPYPGCTREETLELQVKSILDELRNESGKICTSLLSPDNKPLIMFNSGSKGALINIAQMVACVGQQNVSGQRIQNGFVGRTLPHFPMGCKDAKSRGFVANSFFTGLEPEEFFFHTMSGREGLIDTAVKTSETGYMQRRIMKFMEDISICYDHSVRTTDGQIVQFLYGDDGLTSALSKSMYKSLVSSFEHIKNINPINKQKILTSVHIDPEVIDKPDKKVIKRRIKSKKTTTEETYEYKDNWILPMTNVNQVEEKVLNLLDNEKFVSKLPYQLRNKVRCYMNWTSRNKPKKLEVRFDIEGENKKDKNKQVDENIANAVKNQLIGFYLVYVENNYTRRSVPLLPSEIKEWSGFLRPLLTELLPPTIYNHSSLSKGMGSVNQFGETIEKVLVDHAERLEKVLEKNYQDRVNGLKNESEVVFERFKLISRVHWLSLEQIFEFIRYSWKDYQKCICEPGESIGALAAQSIGEPTTQMTLKTFHFAGVASMNVTLGVPRITEIINATKQIATPIIEVPLENKTDYNFALQVKSRIEKTTLGQICSSIKQVYTPQNTKLVMTLNRKLIKQLYINVDAYKVRDIVNGSCKMGKKKAPKIEVQAIGEWQLCIDLGSINNEFFQQNSVIATLLQVVVTGGSEVKRAVVKRENTPTGPNYQIAVEGYGLKEVMGVHGVQSSSVKSNHILEVAEVLGIEAARSVIILEIQKCMDAYSIDIDGRYMKLLADVMTFRGQVIGINRHGLQKMRSSTLMLASFEETTDRLFNAAVHQRKDPIKGVSECIITGKPISLGTGSFEIMMAH